MILVGQLEKRGEGKKKSQDSLVEFGVEELHSHSLEDQEVALQVGDDAACNQEKHLLHAEFQLECEPFVGTVR